MCVCVCVGVCACVCVCMRVCEFVSACVKLVKLCEAQKYIVHENSGHESHC